MAFDVLHPASLAEAAALARTHGAAARFLAGGTDLVIQIRRGRHDPAHLIDLTGIAGLAAIDAQGSEHRIGALVTHGMIEAHRPYAGPLEALHEAARVVGGRQVRNVATIGGNVVNASPAADVVPVLLALDAEVDIVGSDATRSVALDALLQGRGQVALAADEIVAGLRFSMPRERAGTAFLKAGRRKAMEISVVCVAVWVELEPQTHRCRAVRIALGAVAARTLRVRRAESLLTGQALDDSVIAAVAAEAAAESSPIDDVRASAGHRRRLVATLVRRALGTAVQRAMGTSLARDPIGAGLQG